MRNLSAKQIATIGCGTIGGSVGVDLTEAGLDTTVINLALSQIRASSDNVRMKSTRQ